MKSTFLILGNQLFPLKHLSEYSDSTFVMIEHAELASHFKYHKHKIILFFSAMRTYAEELKAEDFKLIYQKFESKKASSKFTKDLHRMMGTSSKLVCFEIEDKFFESEIVEFCRDNNIDLEFVSSPMFLCSRDDFKKYNDRVKKPFMKNFYESQRKNMKV
ncbi:MAG: cryptochrome/photolyase family protein, partial [Bdellovibrionales bacterium]